MTPQKGLSSTLKLLLHFWSYDNSLKNAVNGVAKQNSFYRFLIKSKSHVGSCQVSKPHDKSNLFKKVGTELTTKRNKLRKFKLYFITVDSVSYSLSKVKQFYNAVVHNKVSSIISRVACVASVSLRFRSKERGATELIIKKK